MADISLAQAAYDDLEEIDRYTLETWGETQRTRYLSALFQDLELVAASWPRAYARCRHSST